MISRRIPFLVALLVAIGLGRSAHAETITVPCDVPTLSTALAAVNTNGQEDFVWLAPGCTYALPELWSVEADAGNPVWIYGRGATLSGGDQHTVLIVSIGATLHLNDVTVTKGKSAGDGGAISSIGTLTLTDSTVSDSEAAGYGGGIENLGTLRLTRSTVSGNTASVQGGGIDNLFGRLTVAESTISHNIGLYGGGIRNGGIASLSNSTVFDNGGFVGGGLLNDSNGRAALGNVTFSKNAISGSDGGGGIRNEGALAIDNSIVANTAFGLADCFNSGTITATGGNLVEDGSCAIDGALDGDPGFFAVASSARFLPLGPSSPAIDAGDNASCPGIDQSGARRPRDGHSDGTSVCDLGSHESACGLLGIEPFLVLPFARRLVRSRSRRG